MPNSGFSLLVLDAPSVRLASNYDTTLFEHTTYSSLKIFVVRVFLLSYVIGFDLVHFHIFDC